jgi:hypothetical protein
MDMKVDYSENIFRGIATSRYDTDVRDAYLLEEFTLSLTLSTSTLKQQSPDKQTLIDGNLC